MLKSDERTAAIGGTRQMMHADEFGALVTILVDCGAVPRTIMAAALKRVADGLIRKARGELETDWNVFPAECFDRARELDWLAARIEEPLQTSQRRAQNGTAFPS